MAARYDEPTNRIVSSLSDSIENHLKKSAGVTLDSVLHSYSGSVAEYAQAYPVNYSDRAIEMKSVGYAMGRLFLEVQFVIDRVLRKHCDTSCRAGSSS